MFKYVEHGEKELINQGEMPEATRIVLMEILTQNRMILEANCLTMRLLGQPMMFVAREDVKA